MRMRIFEKALAAALLVALFPGCAGREPVSVIFTGDDEGKIFSGG